MRKRQGSSDILCKSAPPCTRGFANYLHAGIILYTPAHRSSKSTRVILYLFVRKKDVWTEALDQKRVRLFHDILKHQNTLEKETQVILDLSVVLVR